MSQVSFTGDARGISKYFERFQRLIELKTVRRVEYSEGGHPCNVVDEVPGPLELKGNIMLIERLPKVDMKTKSGIIIPNSVKGYRDTHADMVTDFGLVLMTGPGDVLDDGTRAEMETRVGDVILLPNSVYWYSTFGALADYEANTIGIVRDSQVLMNFRDYIKAFEVLNG